MGNIDLSEQEWGRFFDYLHRIVNGDGTWQDRKADVDDASSFYSETPSDLDEFAGWFSDDK